MSNNLEMKQLLESKRAIEMECLPAFCWIVCNRCKGDKETKPFKDYGMEIECSCEQSERECQVEKEIEVFKTTTNLKEKTDLLRRIQNNMEQNKENTAFLTKFDCLTRMFGSASWFYSTATGETEKDANLLYFLKNKYWFKFGALGSFLVYTSPAFQDLFFKEHLVELDKLAQNKLSDFTEESFINAIYSYIDVHSDIELETIMNILKPSKASEFTTQMKLFYALRVFHSFESIFSFENKSKALDFTALMASDSEFYDKYQQKQFYSTEASQAKSSYFLLNNKISPEHSGIVTFLEIGAKARALGRTSNISYIRATREALTEIHSILECTYECTDNVILPTPPSKSAESKAYLKKAVNMHWTYALLLCFHGVEEATASLTQEDERLEAFRTAEMVSAVLIELSFEFFEVALFLCNHMIAGRNQTEESIFMRCFGRIYLNLLHHSTERPILLEKLLSNRFTDLLEETEETKEKRLRKSINSLLNELNMDCSLGDGIDSKANIMLSVAKIAVDKGVSMSADKLKSAVGKYFIKELAELIYFTERRGDSTFSANYLNSTLENKTSYFSQNKAELVCLSEILANDSFKLGAMVEKESGDLALNELSLSVLSQLFEYPLTNSQSACQSLSSRLSLSCYNPSHKDEFVHSTIKNILSNLIPQGEIEIFQDKETFDKCKKAVKIIRRHQGIALEIGKFINSYPKGMHFKVKQRRRCGFWDNLVQFEESTGMFKYSPEVCENLEEETNTSILGDTLYKFSYAWDKLLDEELSFIPREYLKILEYNNLLTEECIYILDNITKIHIRYLPYSLDILLYMLKRSKLTQIEVFSAFKDRLPLLIGAVFSALLDFFSVASMSEHSAITKCLFNFINKSLRFLSKLVENGDLSLRKELLDLTINIQFTPKQPEKQRKTLKLLDIFAAVINQTAIFIEDLSRNVEFTDTCHKNDCRMQILTEMFQLTAVLLQAGGEEEINTHLNAKIESMTHLLRARDSVGVFYLRSQLVCALLTVHRHLESTPKMQRRIRETLDSPLLPRIFNELYILVDSMLFEAKRVRLADWSTQVSVLAEWTDFNKEPRYLLDNLVQIYAYLRFDLADSLKTIDERCVDSTDKLAKTVEICLDSSRKQLYFLPFNEFLILPLPKKKEFLSKIDRSSLVTKQQSIIEFASRIELELTVEDQELLDYKEEFVTFYEIVLVILLLMSLGAVVTVSTSGSNITSTLEGLSYYLYQFICSMQAIISLIFLVDKIKLETFLEFSRLSKLHSDPGILLKASTFLSILKTEEVTGIAFILVTSVPAGLDTDFCWLIPLQLVLVTHFSPSLKSVLRAAFSNLMQILTILLLTTLLLLTFGFYVFANLRSSFVSEGYMLCQSMGHCLVSIADFALRSPGGVGDYFELTEWRGEQYWVKSALSVMFYLVFPIFIVNLLNSVIVNSIMEYRAKVKARKHDTLNVCSVCGGERKKIDLEEGSFAVHVKDKHRLFNYVLFIISVQRKIEAECTYPELKIKQALAKNDFSWIPTRQTGSAVPLELKKQMNTLQTTLEAVLNRTIELEDRILIKDSETKVFF